MTSPTSLTYEANFPKLIGIIKQDLQHISKYELSWIGRIAAMKIILLPKIIYHFRTIPIIIPDHFFKEVDKLFRQFIWGKKMAKI